MNSQTAAMARWLDTPAGRYLLGWEQAQLDRAVGDIFGYHALQLGFPALAGLRANRMPHRWLALLGMEPADAASTQQAAPPPQSFHSAPSAHDVTAVHAASSHRAVALVTDAGALPFAAASLDLVLLPHTLELSLDPHATLREVERVLVPGGRVLISGVNPASLWGLRQSRLHLYRRCGVDEHFLPAQQLIGYGRLRDWLGLLSFEVESTGFGCYRPAMTSQRWLDRLGWLDRTGSRWWPIFGAAYVVVAVKRVRGMRRLEALNRVRKSPTTVPATASRGHQLRAGPAPATDADR